ncbi:MAG TPA: sulfatase-like hydrolase/transferase, partial [Phycisphaerae bacterium]|nr:sulfatase-like hydrolase/transferase [Phycisphaerae bacterium]
AASHLTHSAFVAEQTLEYLKARRGGEPFFCIGGFYFPHEPWIVPQEFLNLYDEDAMELFEFPEDLDRKRQDDPRFNDATLRASRRGYYAAVSELDHQIGRILDGLDELGLADDTIVIYTSDHGEFLGEHLRYGKGYPAPDCVMRVPLIARWPGQLGEPGQTRHQLTEAVDLVPTLLSWAGVQVPPHVQGRPLPLTDDDPGKRAALLEFTGYKVLRLDSLRYIAHADGSETLIDLDRDRGEYHNVAGDPGYADRLALCRHELNRKLLEMERPLPRVWPY